MPVPADPKRPRFVLGLVIGLVVAVLAGGGAYFLGTQNAGGGSAKPTPSATAAPSPSLNVFDANQKALNEPILDGSLAAIGQPWLALLSGCLANDAAGGPALQKDEARHVNCRYGAVSVQFAEYKTAADRDAARRYRQQLHVSGANLAPGQEDPTSKTGAVTGAQGYYVEYAAKRNSDGKALCGVWWERTGETTAEYFETLCKEEMSGDWGVLRDVWARTS